MPAGVSGMPAPIRRRGEAGEVCAEHCSELAVERRAPVAALGESAEASARVAVNTGSWLEKRQQLRFGARSRALHFRLGGIHIGDIQT